MSDVGNKSDQLIGDSGKKRKKGSGDYSLGETIDLMTTREWDLLTDLYLCRCMPQSFVIDTYFLGDPAFYYKEYDSADNEKKKSIERKNKERAKNKTRRVLQRLKDRGIVESSSLNPDVSDLPIHKRSHLRGNTWYYLTHRGLRLMEMKLGILEENKLSKHELDMERSKKDHFWELGKVYLNLKYNWISQFSDFKQFDQWDWYPSLSVYSDNETFAIRPDAVLRVGLQIFYIELDRSTEPIQRSPFVTEQVSIERKLERYKEVMRLSTNKIIRKGYIAFILPVAVYKTRLNNICAAAERVFGKQNSVLVGKDIEEIMISFSDIHSDNKNN